MGAYFVQQEREQKRRHAGLVGAITHTHTQTYIRSTFLLAARLLTPEFFSLTLVMD